MQSNGNVIRNPGILWPAHAWEAVKEWVRANRAHEAVLDAVLSFTTIGSAGFVLLSLHRIVTNWTLTGF